MEDICAGFIGFGLIGGSIAKAIKAHFSNSKIMVHNHHINQKNENLELALKDGTIDQITSDLSKEFSNCEIIFLCGPVLTNITYLKQLKDIIHKDTIITDVGSVKGNIHQAIREQHLEHNFIGGHPMAGSEKTGYNQSSAYLLENAYYILTPEPEISQKKLIKLKKLITKISSIPIILKSKQHDDITAAISHVPHIISASLVNFVGSHDTDEHYMKELAAGGFKDITRISSSSPELWENICSSNKESILKFLNYFKSSLEEFEQGLQENNSNKLTSLFQSAKEYRNSLPIRKKGPISTIYEIYLDLVDETGAIATVATILASNAISIQNIGIIHNREFEDGVLRIEVYDDDSFKKAIKLLKQYHYTVYER